VHAYGAAHTYTVTLTVTNSLGQSATVSKTVPVAAAP
jgi:PKD repeat protein